ncbi:MAG: hypothetical protein WD688_21770 [Candidatus Binatia bacterium]
MRRASLILLILALVGFAFAIVRWVAQARQIAEEKEEQKWTGRVAFDLSRQEGWKTSDYVPRRAGLYSLVLETQGRSWKPHPIVAFSGSFEVEILDASGKLAKRKHVDGRSIYHTNENHVHWSGLDTVTIETTGSGAWKIRVLTSQPDANFTEMTSAIILQPPSRFDVGWAGFSGGIEIALIAASGFILLVAAGGLLYFARRNTRRGG